MSGHADGGIETHPFLVKGTGRKRVMNKSLAVIVAALMVVAMPIGLVAVDADTTTTVNGQYSVYAYDGQGWDSDIVSAYDAAQAVVASKMWENGDSMVAKYTPGTWVTYNYDTYGNISKFMGVPNNENSQWNVFYINTSDVVVKATHNLGSYKCFDDYDENHRTANIILYYGPSTVSASDVSGYSSFTGSVAESDITEMDYSDAYAVTFTLSIRYDGANAVIAGDLEDADGNAVTNNRLKTSTVNVVGYGSDCYLALKDALGSEDNCTGTDAIPNQGYNPYGWMGKMLGLEMVQTAGTLTPSDWTDDKYAYWCIYDDGTHLADFVLGAYSPLNSAGEPFGDNSFALTYQEVAM